MIAKNVTAEDLNKALQKVNEQFDNNIIFKSGPDPVGRRVRFTLTVKDSRKDGGRIGFTGRHVAAACWHVHGEFFDALIEIAPDAEIRTNGNHVITAECGNWEDRNIGSILQPLYYSDACNC